MVIMLLEKHFTDAILKECIASNLLHYCSFKGPIVDVKLDDNKVSGLAYTAYYIQGMGGLFEVVCDRGVIEVQSASRIK